MNLNIVYNFYIKNNHNLKSLIKESAPARLNNKLPVAR